MKPFERRYKLGDSINWDYLQIYGRDRGLSIDIFNHSRLIAPNPVSLPSRFFTL